MTHAVLGQVYMFKSISPEDLNQVAQIAKVDKWRAGETVFSQGEKARAMYVIKLGSVSIKRSTPSGEEVEIAIVGTGDHFGEMAFVSSTERTGTARVIENSEILRIDFDKLRALLEINSRIAAAFYKATTYFLSGRLAETTKDLSFAREKIRHRG